MASGENDMTDKPKFEGHDFTFTLPDAEPSKLFEVFIPWEFYSSFWPDEGSGITLKDGEGLDISFDPKKANPSQT